MPSGVARNPPAPPPGRGRGHNIPKRVVDAAAEVFARKSYNGTSLQDIADAVGMQKGSLYHYIETKDDLLYAIIRDAHEAALESNQRWQEIEDPVEAIRAFAEDHIRVGLDNLVYTRVYMQDFRSLSDTRRNEILASRDSYEKALLGLIKKAAKQGSLRKGLDPRVGTIAVLGMLNWLSTWYRPDGPMKPEFVVSQLSEAAIACLR